MLTVYFSNQQMTLVQGRGGSRPSIERVYRMDAPEGSLINGIATDEDTLSTALRDFWAQNKLPKKNVQLVVNSTQLVFRALDAPKQNRKKQTAYLRREFSDSEQTENMSFGWWVLSEDSKNRVCRLAATGGPRAYLEGLVHLFRAAGIQISGICTALDAALAVLMRLPQGKETCILQIADGSSLLHILMVNGVYTYSATNRLYCAPGSAEYGSEAARCISNILQFIRAQRIEADVKNVYLAGMQPEDAEHCAAETVGLAPELSVRQLTCGNGFAMAARLKASFDQSLYPVGGLLLGGNPDGLLHGLAQSAEKAKSDSAFWKRALPPILIGAGLAAACGATGVRNVLLQAQYRELESYLAGENVTAAVAQYDQLHAENTAMQAGLAEIKGDWAALQSYPHANSTLETVLQNCTSGYDVTVTFSSYDAASGQLNFTTTSADVETINRYVELLREQDCFVTVEYTGYSYNAAAQNWNVNVVCTLSETAGK